ncbi:MAG TPA: aldehyde dehydrogenase family protein, partial [Chloroflexota bacterium]|nr:aldehyde dehydrogenase family protein [Chloroflexota bacterium]
MITSQKTISPVDQSVYVERDLATPEQIDHALDTATRAQREWKHVPIADRAALCLAMVEAFVAKAGELGTELSWQMGRPIRYTPNEVKGGFNERARSMIAAAAGALADLEVEPKQGFTRFIRHEPLGVV